MGIGENCSVFREAIQMRSGYLRVRIQGLDISVAHFISEDQEDVGAFICRGWLKGEGQEKEDFRERLHRGFRAYVSFARGLPNLV